MSAGMFYGNLENIVNKQELGYASFRRGIWGELKALLFIMTRGYLPLYRRYRTKYGEIDIIAKKKNTLIFIEVKSRPTAQGGYDSISFKQKERIKNTALAFFRKHPKYHQCGMRFDAVIISPNKWPTHLMDVW